MLGISIVLVGEIWYDHRTDPWEFPDDTVEVVGVRRSWVRFKDKDGTLLTLPEDSFREVYRKL